MSKLAKINSLKALGAGKEITDEQLARINKFALSPLTAEQVYVRKFLIAHNFLDRDNERFTEELLEDFAGSLPGKSLFVEGHPSSWSGKSGPGEGRWFAAYTEEMSPQAYNTLTGEEADLPEGVEMVKVLWGEAYILKLDSNSDLLAKLDGGVIPFISIGFKAPWFSVTDEHGNHKYGEYRPNGEAREASLVWLGAQPGAGPVKHINEEEGDQQMKGLFEKLSKVLGKTVTEENAVETIGADMSAKASRIRELEPLAKDGESWRKSLVDDVLKFGQLIGEIPDSPENQKQEGEFIATWPVERIKALRDKYEARARKKFPTDPSFKSKDEDSRKADEEAAEKKSKTKNKKDYSDPASGDNELFGSIGK